MLTLVLGMRYYFGNSDFEPRRIFRNLQCLPKLGSLKLIKDTYIRKMKCHHSRKCLTILILCIREAGRLSLYYFFILDFSCHGITVSLKPLILSFLFFHFFVPCIFKRCFSSPVFPFLLLSALSSRVFCPLSSDGLNPSFSFPGISIAS